MESLDRSWASFFYFLRAISKPWKRVSMLGYCYIGGIMCCPWSAILANQQASPWSDHWPCMCRCLKPFFRRDLSGRPGAFEALFKHIIYTGSFLRNVASFYLFFGSGIQDLVISQYRTELYNPRILNSSDLGPILVEFMRGSEITTVQLSPFLSRVLMTNSLR